VLYTTRRNETRVAKCTSFTRGGLSDEGSNKIIRAERITFVDRPRGYAYHVCRGTLKRVKHPQSMYVRTYVRMYVCVSYYACVGRTLLSGNDQKENGDVVCSPRAYAYNNTVVEGSTETSKAAETSLRATRTGPSPYPAGF